MLRMDRHGYRHWARAPAGTRIYAIGDVHGRLDLLDEMHVLIRNDAEGAAQGLRRLVVYLGDYIDRGPRSSAVIDRLLENPMSPDFECVYLRGNHEDIMLGFLDSGSRAAPWALLAQWMKTLLLVCGMTLAASEVLTAVQKSAARMALQASLRVAPPASSRSPGTFSRRAREG